MPDGGLNGWTSEPPGPRLRVGNSGTPWLRMHRE